VTGPAPTARDRVRAFLTEQRVHYGRSDAYELWGDTGRPEAAITLGDLQELLDEQASRAPVF